MVKSKSLSLPMPRTVSPVSSSITSPSDPGSRKTSPDRGQKIYATEDGSERHAHGIGADSAVVDEDPELGAPPLTSLPSIPPEPKHGPRHGRDHSRSLFANLRAAKSSNKLDNLEPTIRQVPDDISHGTDSGETALYSLHRSPGSTPDLSLSASNSTSLGIPECQS